MGTDQSQQRRLVPAAGDTERAYRSGNEDKKLIRQATVLEHR